MPTQLDTFNFTRKKKYEAGKYDTILDGKIWKVLPSEFGFEDDADGVADFVKAVKKAAKVEYSRYLFYNVTMGNHVILQMQPAEYVPPVVKSKRDKKEK